MPPSMRASHSCAPVDRLAELCLLPLCFASYPTTTLPFSRPGRAVLVRACACAKQGMLAAGPNSRTGSYWSSSARQPAAADSAGHIGPSVPAVAGKHPRARNTTSSPTRAEDPRRACLVSLSVHYCFYKDDPCRVRGRDRLSPVVFRRCGRRGHRKAISLKRSRPWCPALYSLCPLCASRERGKPYGTVARPLGPSNGGAVGKLSRTPVEAPPPARRPHSSTTPETFSVPTLEVLPPFMN